MNKAQKVKKANTSKSNKKTSTNERSNSNKKKKKNTNKKNENEQIVQTIKQEIKDKLTLLKEKTESLRANLDQIKKDIDLERNNSIQDAHDLNERIKEVNNEMNRLSVDNRYLTNSFSSLEKRLVKEINQNLIKRGRKGNKNDIEERLNKNIKLKEKMILNNKTNLQLIKNEIDYLEEEVEENEAPDRKEKLEKMLEELRTTQNKKKKEIEELKTMKTEHNKICTKRLRELLKLVGISVKD